MFFLSVFLTSQICFIYFFFTYFIIVKVEKENYLTLKITANQNTK